MAIPSFLSAIHKLRSLLTRSEKMTWILLVGVAFFTSLLEILTASVIVILAQVLNQPETGHSYLSRIGLQVTLSQGRMVFYMALFCGVIYLIKNLGAAAEVFYQNFSIQRMHCQFKSKLLRRYAKADYEYTLSRNSAQGYSVVSSDVEQIFSCGMISLAGLLSEGMVFLCLVGIVIFMNPSLAFLVFFIASLLSIGVSKGILPLFYGWGKGLQEASLHCNRNLLQFFHAFKEILLLGKKESFIQAYEIHAAKRARVQALQSATNALPRMVIEVLFMGLFVAAIGYLCLEHETPSQMIGILGGYLYVGFRLMPGLNRLINHLNTFKSITPSIERVHADYYAITEKESYADIPAFTFEKGIHLEKVTYSYSQGAKPALLQVDLHIEKGECLGIIGETGSGKSTLVDLILGLLHPTEGKILIDGLYTPCCFQWHQKIGYVPQSIYLTDDTIQANIAFGEDPTQVDLLRLEKAIEASQLVSFIQRLPHGTQTLVGERGLRLSGGERQRIAIARALYLDPEVLIFDEATSALDTETETRLMETIRALQKNRTVLMIAHRLTTLKDCNRIVVLDQGRLRQITTYQNLEISS